jgi:hypothetical protein
MPTWFTKCTRKNTLLIYCDVVLNFSSDIGGNETEIIGPVLSLTAYTSERKISLGHTFKINFDTSILKVNI